MFPRIPQNGQGQKSAWRGARESEPPDSAPRTAPPPALRGPATCARPPGALGSAFPAPSCPFPSPRLVSTPTHGSRQPAWPEKQGLALQTCAELDSQPRHSHTGSLAACARVALKGNFRACRFGYILSLTTRLIPEGKASETYESISVGLQLPCFNCLARYIKLCHSSAVGVFFFFYKIPSS